MGAGGEQKGKKVLDQWVSAARMAFFMLHTFCVDRGGIFGKKKNFTAYE